MLYHIKLMERIDNGECKINITEEEPLTRYGEPINYGEKIVKNGTALEPKELWRVKITQSEIPIDNIIQQIEQQDSMDRSPYYMLRPSAKWRAIDKVEDVTDKYINVAHGSKTREALEGKKQKMTNNKKVFVVHGHDTELKTDVELFLRSINLEPIVLHRQLDE